MNNKLFFSSFILIICLLAACKKNEFRRDEYVSPSGKGFVKIAYFSPDSITRSVQIYINNKLVSNTINNHTPFPGGGYNTLGSTFNGYLAVEPDKGNAYLRFVTPNTGSSIINKELFTLTAPVTVNDRQIIYITDTAANTTAITVKTETSRPDSGYVKMQFVNIIPDSGPISFYYKDSLVADRVMYKQVVDFKTLPLYTTTFKMYHSDSIPRATSMIGTAYTFSSISNQKIYSVFARGYQKIKSTTDTRYAKTSIIVVQ